VLDQEDNPAKSSTKYRTGDRKGPAPERAQPVAQWNSGIDYSEHSCRQPATSETGVLQQSTRSQSFLQPAAMHSNDQIVVDAPWNVEASADHCTVEILDSGRTCKYPKQVALLLRIHCRSRSWKFWPAGRCSSRCSPHAAQYTFSK